LARYGEALRNREPRGDRSRTQVVAAAGGITGKRHRAKTVTKILKEAGVRRFKAKDITKNRSDGPTIMRDINLQIEEWNKYLPSAVTAQVCVCDEMLVGRGQDGELFVFRGRNQRFNVQTGVRARQRAGARKLDAGWLQKTGTAEAEAGASSVRRRRAALAGRGPLHGAVQHVTASSAHEPSPA
jgi:hypothetical protein